MEILLGFAVAAFIIVSVFMMGFYCGQINVNLKRMDRILREEEEREE